VRDFPAFKYLLRGGRKGRRNKILAQRGEKGGIKSAGIRKTCHGSATREKPLKTAGDGWALWLKSSSGEKKASRGGEKGNGEEKERRCENFLTKKHRMKYTR